MNFENHGSYKGANFLRYKLLKNKTMKLIAQESILKIKNNFLVKKLCIEILHNLTQVKNKSFILCCTINPVGIQ